MDYFNLNEAQMTCLTGDPNI